MEGLMCVSAARKCLTLAADLRENEYSHVGMKLLQHFALKTSLIIVKCAKDLFSLF